MELAQATSTNPPPNEIPLLGDIAAGSPIDAIENTTETILIPHDMIRSKNQLFALNIRGDSMIEKGILDGDLAIIEFGQNFKQGDIVAAIINEEATLKIIKKRK